MVPGGLAPCSIQLPIVSLLTSRAKGRQRLYGSARVRRVPGAEKSRRHPHSLRTAPGPPAGPSQCPESLLHQCRQVPPPPASPSPSRLDRTIPGPWGRSALTSPLWCALPICSQREPVCVSGTGLSRETGKLPRGPVSQEKGCCSFLPGGAVLSPTNPHGCFHLVGPAKATPAPSSGGGSQRAWGPSRCPHRADRAASSAKPPGWARKRI